MNRRRSPGARELIELVLDPGTWRSWDEDVSGLERLDLGPVAGDGHPGYAGELARARGGGSVPACWVRVLRSGRRGRAG